MITIHFNNQAEMLKTSCTLTELLTEHAVTNNSYAVVLNQHFIPRSQYLETLLKDGDRIELISPMQGG